MRFRSSSDMKLSVKKSPIFRASIASIGSRPDVCFMFIRDSCKTLLLSNTLSNNDTYSGIYQGLRPFLTILSAALPHTLEPENHKGWNVKNKIKARLCDRALNK